MFPNQVSAEHHQEFRKKRESNDRNFEITRVIPNISRKTAKCFSFILKYKLVYIRHIATINVLIAIGLLGYKKLL